MHAKDLDRILADAAPARSIIQHPRVLTALEGVEPPQPKRRSRRRWVIGGVAGVALATTAAAALATTIVPTIWGERTGYVELEPVAMGDGYGACTFAVISIYLGEEPQDGAVTPAEGALGIPGPEIDISGGGGTEPEAGIATDAMSYGEFVAVRDWVAEQDLDDDLALALAAPLPVEGSNPGTVTDAQFADYQRAEGAGYALLAMIGDELAAAGLNEHGSAGLGFTVQCDVDA